MRPSLTRLIPKLSALQIGLQKSGASGWHGPDAPQAPHLEMESRPEMGEMGAGTGPSALDSPRQFTGRAGSSAAAQVP